ncbi:hypothetical protein D3C71_851490 [compost metagenome]
MADQLLTAAQAERGSIDIELARAIAEGMASRRLSWGWPRQTILECNEGGPTPCRRGFYLMKAGGIAIAPFPFTCFGEMSGRGGLYAISQLLRTIDLRPTPNTATHRPAWARLKSWKSCCRWTAGGR